MLHRLADLIEARSEEFATLESLDIGKPGFEPRAIDDCARFQGARLARFATLLAADRAQASAAQG
jgi:acyl-CoA reductase-like NAD-dependent aldehyde dehydrogenase